MDCLGASPPPSSPIDLGAFPDAIAAELDSYREVIDAYFTAH
ncbi:hypothetical protein [Tessaracoccus sp. OH4464_COT-324]|nr:hypothetical protein [Tessaracoccus sp. OH4464_COT-324]